MCIQNHIYGFVPNCIHMTINVLNIKINIPFVGQYERKSLE